MTRQAVGPLFFFSVAVLAQIGSASAHVELSSKPTQNMSCADGVCTPTAPKAFLNVNDLAGMLASGDTSIRSTSQNPDIEINAALSWTSTSHLTLDAYHSIAFNDPVVVAGTGALTILTNDGGSAGDFRFNRKGHVEFWDLSSNLVINSVSYTLVNQIKRFKNALRHDGDGNYALAKSINTHRSIYAKSPIDAFGGVFEGLGNTISNLTIEDSLGADNVGFFGELVQPAIVRDIGLSNVDIQAAGGEQKVGALAGELLGQVTVKNSYSTGSVSGNGNSSVGGLIGDSAGGHVETSHADVKVFGEDNTTAVGGLVGVICCGAVVDRSYATGQTSGGVSVRVGGLVGYNLGATIVNSYSIGSTSGGSSSLVGGATGENADDSSEGTSPVLTGVFSTGLVFGDSGATVGGLIGRDATDAQNTNNYWDLDTSGISDPSHGAGNISNDPGITGLSDTQLKSGLPVGFDKRVWKEKSKLDDGYPYLVDNPPPK